MERAAVAGLRIGEVARRTGVTVPTIRAWESRYGLVRPDRTAGGQRLYSEADVARISGIRQRVEQGWLVSAAVAQLHRDEEGAATRPDPSGPGDTRPDHPAPLPPASERASVLQAIDPDVLALAYRSLREMLAAGEPARVRDVLVELVTKLGGEVGPARDHDPDALPLDLSFGHGPQVLPRAPGGSVARLRLETVLPGLVEDGRDVVVALSRAARPRAGSS